MAEKVNINSNQAQDTSPTLQVGSVVQVTDEDHTLYKGFGIVKTTTLPTITCTFTFVNDGQPIQTDVPIADFQVVGITTLI